MSPNYNPDAAIPNSWEVPDKEPAFPEGNYLAVLGGIHPVTDDSGAVIAVNSDIYILKYQGTDALPKDDVRVTIKEGKVMMAPKGSKLVERYPSPMKMPKMAWKARGFFSNFNCIAETETGRMLPNGEKEKKSLIDWQLVKMAAGSVFRFSIAYNKGKDGKSYRNISYDSIQVLEQRVTAADLKKIEEEYELMRKAADVEAAGGEYSAPPSADDLPF